MVVKPVNTEAKSVSAHLVLQAFYELGNFIKRAEILLWIIILILLLIIIVLSLQTIIIIIN